MAVRTSWMTRSSAGVVKSSSFSSGENPFATSRCAPAGGRLGAAVASGTRSALMAPVTTTLIYVSTRGGD